jgi:hypothetical protein
LHTNWESFNEYDEDETEAEEEEDVLSTPAAAGMELDMATKHTG